MGNLLAAFWWVILNNNQLFYFYSKEPKSNIELIPLFIKTETFNSILCLNMPLIKDSVEKDICLK